MDMNSYKSIFDLSGKRALVTGAGRADGIGAAIAKGLSAHGAEVVIHDVGSIAEEIIEEIIVSGGKVKTIIQDLSQLSSGRSLIEQVSTEIGQIDILVLNASCQLLVPFTEQTNEQIERQIAVNFQSNIEMLQTCLPLMKHQGWGRVVNIGSVNQAYPKPVVSIYAATKAANHNLIQSLSREYASSGVLMNTLAPGLVDTYPNNRVDDKDAQLSWDNYATQLNSIGRAGLPSEMIGAAVYLSSNACNFMTGESMFVTGGQFG